MKGRNLASERTRLGLTQVQLAERLGTTEKSIGLYEKGERVVPSELLETMADLFGCSTDYLLDRVEERLPRGAAQR